MLLADNLRSGEGYRDLWLPDPMPHTRYPPVYPLLLAGLGVIANSVILFKLLSLACTTGVAALVFLLTEKRTRNRQLALIAGLLAASAPVVVEYSHWVLSEPSFVFFVVLALYAFARDREAADPRVFAVGTAAALLATLTRSAGYALLPAVVLSLGVQRRWKRCAVFVGAAVLVVGAWWIRNQGAVSEDLPYTQWLLFRDPYRPELGTVTAAELVPRFVLNLKLYVLAVLPESLGGRDLGGWLAGTIGVVLAIAIAAGSGRRIRRLEATELFFWLYMCLILLWPPSWADQRLLLPVLPLGIVFLMEAFDWGAHVRPSGAGRWAFPALYAVLLFLTFFANARILGRQLYCSRQYWAGQHYACYPPTFKSFVDAAIWAADNTERDAIIVNRKPQMFYWYSHRRGVVYPYTEDSDSLMRFLDSQRARYVVIDRWSTTTYRYLVPVIQASLQQFDLVHMDGDPPTLVLRYRREGAR